MAKTQEKLSQIKEVYFMMVLAEIKASKKANFKHYKRNLMKFMKIKIF